MREVISYVLMLISGIILLGIGKGDIYGTKDEEDDKQS